MDDLMKFLIKWVLGWLIVGALAIGLTYWLAPGEFNF
jgi:hypothetical protein